MTVKELKELGDDLDKIDAESYENLNYEETIKRWKEKRDDYDRKSKDNKNTLLKKLEYERSKKFVNEKIDILNYKFNKPLETEEGKEIVKKLNRSKMWFFQRWYQDAKDHKYGILGYLLATILGGIVNFASSAIYNTLYYGSEGVKKIAPAALVQSAPVVASTLIKVAIEIPKFLLWIADNIVEFVIGAISMSIFLHQEYGEEASFPILAFWSYILAMGMFGLHYIHSTYESAKQYIPFTN